MAGMSPLTPRQEVLARMSWRQWQTQVIKWARYGGWKVYAINDSRTQHWGTDTGFPDVLMLRDGRQIVAECKCGSGRERADQRGWREAFELVPGVEAYVFRPEDGDQIRELLLQGVPVQAQVMRGSMRSSGVHKGSPASRQASGASGDRRETRSHESKPFYRQS